MPVPITNGRNPFEEGVTSRPTTRSRGNGLRVPQARILAALMPSHPEDPPSEWTVMARAALSLCAGYTAISGTVTRALNGIRSPSSSGNAHPGLIDLGYVEVVLLDIDGVTEINYRITTEGIAAYQKHIATYDNLPNVKGATSCTNKRYISKRQ